MSLFSLINGAYVESSSDSSGKSAGTDSRGGDYYQDRNGRWHRPNGEFASNEEMGIERTPTVSSSTHGNSLSDSRTNYGYVLTDRDSGAILKYSESLDPTHRYSQSYLDSVNADMEVIVSGTKADIHFWQHNMNEQYKSIYGEYPPLCKRSW